MTNGHADVDRRPLPSMLLSVRKTTGCFRGGTGLRCGGGSDVDATTGAREPLRSG